MSDEFSNQSAESEEDARLLDRRLFLRSLGKWSGAAILAAVVGGAWLASAPEAEAGAWINRRVGGGVGGGWINRRVGVGGGWINRRVGGGGGWINRRVGGGGGWINRW
jgi:hypothetical protein